MDPKLKKKADEAILAIDEVLLEFIKAGVQVGNTPEGMNLSRLKTARMGLRVMVNQWGQGGGQ